MRKKAVAIDRTEHQQAGTVDREIRGGFYGMESGTQRGVLRNKNRQVRNPVIYDDLIQAAAVAANRQRVFLRVVGEQAVIQNVARVRAGHLSADDPEVVFRRLNGDVKGEISVLVQDVAGGSVNLAALRRGDLTAVENRGDKVADRAVRALGVDVTGAENQLLAGVVAGNTPLAACVERALFNRHRSAVDCINAAVRAAFQRELARPGDRQVFARDQCGAACAQLCVLLRIDRQIRDRIDNALARAGIVAPYGQDVLRRVVGEPAVCENIGGVALIYLDPADLEVVLRLFPDGDLGGNAAIGIFNRPLPDLAVLGLDQCAINQLDAALKAGNGGGDSCGDDVAVLNDQLVGSRKTACNGVVANGADVGILERHRRVIYGFNAEVCEQPQLAWAGDPQVLPGCDRSVVGVQHCVLGDVDRQPINIVYDQATRAVKVSAHGQRLCIGVIGERAVSENVLAIGFGSLRSGNPEVVADRIDVGLDRIGLIGVLGRKNARTDDPPIIRCCEPAALHGEIGKACDPAAIAAGLQPAVPYHQLPFVVTGDAVALPEGADVGVYQRHGSGVEKDSVGFCAVDRFQRQLAGACDGEIAEGEKGCAAAGRQGCIICDEDRQAGVVVDDGVDAEVFAALHGQGVGLCVVGEQAVAQDVGSVVAGHGHSAHHEVVALSFRLSRSYRQQGEYQYQCQQQKQDAL